MSATPPRELGRVFQDSEVVELYRYREPYPAEVFAILERLMVEPRVALDAGCGTGSLARKLRFADRVDALDPSTAMIEAGRLLPGGGDPRIRWTAGRAEDGPISPPYGLITCGASLHWMDLDVVLPRFRAALAPGARLAIVNTDTIHAPGPFREDVLAVIRRYSPISHHRGAKDLVDGLVASRRLILEGEVVTAPVAFAQPADDYIKLLGSTSTLSRPTLGPRAGEFDTDMRAVFARYGVDRVAYDVAGYVAWGRPA